MSSLGKDIKSETFAKYALASTAVTAGAASDAAEVDGVTIDTTALPCHAQSVVFQVAAVAALTTDKKLEITANLQDSADGTNWTDITDPAVILTITTNGGTGVGRLEYDLTKARRYVRIQATPDLSHTGTDTATMFGIATFGGLQSVPQ